MGMNRVTTNNGFDSNSLLYSLYDEMGQPEILKDMFYACDKPFKYKNILLYPVTMDLCMIFYILANCLVLRKNTSGDINAIQNTYLDYLFYLAQAGNEQYVLYLDKLLLIVLRRTEFAQDEDGHKILTKNNSLIKTVEFIEEKGKMYIYILKKEIQLPFSGICEQNYDKIDSKDFDIIKNIICEQNNIELIDESIHPDKIQKIEEWEEYQAKKNKDKICSLEEQKAILKAIKGWSTEQLDKTTIRSFYTELERFGVLVDYSLLSILKPNMDKKDQDKILNWLGKVKKKTKLEQITCDYDKFNDKFESNKTNKQ